METCFKVLQLKFDRNLSNRTIGLTLNISPSSVFEVLARFNASSTPWPLPEALTPEAIESLIFLEKKASVLAPVLPARPRKPKDKPKAENGVLIVERWLLARIRNETFHTLRGQNNRLRELLADLNNRPMKGYSYPTRAERFALLDAPALLPLPLTAYEYTEFRAVKVAPDYHIEYARHRYSVPHELIGHRLSLKAGQPGQRTASMAHSTAN